MIKHLLKKKFKMSNIIITVNSNEIELESPISITTLIQELQIDPKKIAIEKDLEIINHDDFDSTILNNGCKIEIVHFIGGG